ncbi:MAG: GNAT family N-acetyltransferase [Bacteroidota bacterium]
MNASTDCTIVVAGKEHLGFAEQICEEMAASARARGTGIARRSPEYISEKMLEGKAVIAFAPDGAWAGFCYIETWGHGKYVANSGLIVAPPYRKSGLAKAIKKKIFGLSRSKFPEAKIFGLTTGLAVMKINSELGYEPVTYSELTDDDEFWKGCRSCVNFGILVSKERKNCLCTAMLYDPADKEKGEPAKGLWDFARKSKLYERFMKIKQIALLRGSKSGEEKEKKKSLISFFNF